MRTIAFDMDSMGCFRPGLGGSAPMNPLKYIFLIYFIIHFGGVWAQNTVCDIDDLQPAPDCTRACVLCDLDGLRQEIVATETNFLEINCLQGAGHVFAFMAMSRELTIEVEVLSCDDNQGRNNFVEVTGYKDVNNSCFDDNFGLDGEAIFPCNNPVNGEEVIHRINAGDSKTFSSIVELEIGAIYYLELTTILQNICEYRVAVLEGSTQIPAINSVDLLFPPSPCFGERATHTLLDSVAFSTYFFVLNGDTLSAGPAYVDHIYNEAGDYELCIIGTNPCSVEATTCYSFTVEVPTITADTVNLCPGACVEIGLDSTVCAPGIYPLNLFDQNGCDSLVQYEVITRPQDTTEINIPLCVGDSLVFLGSVFRTATTNNFILRNRYGCDSLVQLTVSLEQCPVLGAGTATSPECNGLNDGVLTFQVTSGVPPFQYNVQRIPGGVVESGRVDNLNEDVLIDDLPIGLYLITIEDRVTSLGYLNYTITDAPQLVLSLSTASPSCHGGHDGQIEVMVSGGTPPHEVTSIGPTNSSGTLQSNLMAGTYEVSVVDQNGCRISQLVFLEDPPPFAIEYVLTEGNCDTNSSGRFSVSGTSSGGIASLELFHNSEVVDPLAYGDLEDGSYTVVGENEFGCRFEDSFSIQRPAQPNYLLTSSNRIVELGETVQLSIAGAGLEAINWRGFDDDCLQPCTNFTVRPLETTVFFAEILSDSGCRLSDSITIVVDPNRRVYVPNAFSPNGDGINDRLQIYPGVSTDKVEEFVVYNRWGQEIYKQVTTHESARELFAWDGRINNLPAAPGVYSWMARISFIDQETHLFKGSFHLIK